MINKLKVIIDKDQYILLLFVFIGLLFAAILEIVGISLIPIFISSIIDPSIIKNKFINLENFEILNNINSNNFLILISFFLIFIFIFKNFFMALIFFMQGKLIKNIRQSLSARIFKLYLDAPYKIHFKKNSSTILRNIDSDTSGSVTVILSFINLLREILILLSIFWLLIYVDFVITGFVFSLLVALVGLFILITRKKIAKNSLILQKFRAFKIQDISEALGAIKEVKIFNKQNVLKERFNEKISIWEKAFLINYFLTSIPKLLLETVVVISIVLIVFSFIFFNRDLNSVIPTLAIYAAASIRMLPSFTSITTSLTYIKTLKPSLNIIFNEIQSLEKLISAEKKIFNKNLIFSNEINFINVNYKYNENTKLAVKNLNLNIKFGAKIGVIGKSGAGKSTFIDLILGLINPSSGKIIIDGEDICENIKSWQTQIGYVPQDVYLLDDTIKNNITFSSNNNVDMNCLNNSIVFSRLDEVIKNSENGIETYVGEKGVRLSGGQKQRIGIARALYKNPSIIIFDEATSSLDSKNEKEIIEEIFSIDTSKTLILVTHKNHVVRKCDIIYLFDNGEIIDQGSYEFLDKKYNLDKFNI